MNFNNTDALREFSTQRVRELDPTRPLVKSAVDTYRNAFALPPYSELYTDEEALAALESVLNRNGDLILGELNGQAISIAGGFMRDDSTYYVEELAVAPEWQGKGVGRKSLQELLTEAERQQPIAFEIRTTASNTRAINLYTSEGFQLQEEQEIAAQFRQDGSLALDPRVYLFKPLAEGIMPEKDKIKRAVIAYPSGNTTAIIFDQLLSADRKVLNQRVMSSWESGRDLMPAVEQCCFVTVPNDPRAVARVEMFGGEFCGNATRSVVQLITQGKDYAGLIEVSGVDRPLGFRVEGGVVNVEMPLPQEGELLRSVAEGTLVQLDGISQLVVLDEELRSSRNPRELLQDLLRENKYALAEQPAVGVSYYDPISNRADFCVWVREVDTIFDETACGSGTCAIGLASTRLNGTPELNVIQPSGESIRTVTVVDPDTGEIKRSEIAGTVNILYDGSMRLK